MSNKCSASRKSLRLEIYEFFKGLKYGEWWMAKHILVLRSASNIPMCEYIYMYNVYIYIYIHMSIKYIVIRYRTQNQTLKIGE